MYASTRLCRVELIESLIQAGLTDQRSTGSLDWKIYKQGLVQRLNHITKASVSSQFSELLSASSWGWILSWSQDGCHQIPGLQVFVHIQQERECDFIKPFPQHPENNFDWTSMGPSPSPLPSPQPHEAITVARRCNALSELTSKSHVNHQRRKTVQFINKYVSGDAGCQRWGDIWLPEEGMVWVGKGRLRNVSQKRRCQLGPEYEKL